MTLYLVRHGKAAAGVEDLDPGLDEVGRRQAEAAARALQAANTRRLIVSPLRRTRETAIPIAESLDCETIVRTEVAEVFDPNMPIEERRAWLGPFMAGRWTGQPRALLEWRQRVVDTLVELGKEADAAAQDLVVVSHYIAIGVAIGEALGDDRVVPVPMANAAITTMHLGPGGLELVDAASTAHLPPELVTGIGQALAGR